MFLTGILLFLRILHRTSYISFHYIINYSLALKNSLHLKKTITLENYFKQLLFSRKKLFLVLSKVFKVGILKET
jgi:hypothetical protein